MPDNDLENKKEEIKLKVANDVTVNSDDVTRPLNMAATAPFASLRKRLG